MEIVPNNNSLSPETIALYIHIPYCRKKCRYCDFFSTAFNRENADSYIEALIGEWEIVRSRYNLQNAIVDSLYFGGGTPSILTPAQWHRVTEQLISPLQKTPAFEWTVECNPDSFSSSSGILFTHLGVTRLSFGIQSLNNKELGIIGRIHDSKQALNTLTSPVLGTFHSVGADLMYGLPGQTLDSLKRSLDILLGCRSIKHISAYELTLTSSTPLGRHHKLLPLPSEEQIVEMHTLIRDVCSKHGLEQYEVSNYAYPGHRCHHNETYWAHRPYIGLGCSAHSFYQNERWANVEDIATYCASIAQKHQPKAFSEQLDSTTIAREMIFLGLRRREGINENEFFEKTGNIFAFKKRTPILEHLQTENLIEYHPPRWSLTSSGILVADAIARELMVEE